MSTRLAVERDKKGILSYHYTTAHVGQDMVKKALKPDDVVLRDLGCRVDILGTNCKKLLKLKMSVCGGGGGGGRGVASALSTCIHVQGAVRRLLLDKKDILSLGVHFTVDKNNDHLLTAVNGPVMRVSYI